LKGADVIQDAADYQAIASTAPFLTHLSVQLPASATTLPQHMASLLSACSKLVDLAVDVYDETNTIHMFHASSLLDVQALAAGTQLLSLQLPCCYRLTNLAPLGALMNQILHIRDCYNVDDLARLGALVDLQELGMSECGHRSDLPPPLQRRINCGELRVGPGVDRFTCFSEPF
jgi:hypothetical protein